MVAAPLAGAQEASGYRPPQFRKIQAAARMPDLPEGTVVRLLADRDFPPFSFLAGSGSATGLAVELGLAACGEIKVRCEIALRPLAELLPALAGGEGDVVVAGPRLDEKTLTAALMTRPWFRSLGRFAVPAASPPGDGDPRALAGKRIAVVDGTAHARWLAAHYAQSQIVAFGSEALAGEALQTGKVDAVFGDGLRLIFWTLGNRAQGCCKLTDGAYSDLGGFSRNFAFLAAAGRPDLRDAFDIALDRLQAKGVTAKLLNAYVPLNPW
jgi:polar amino acid transport system substrate-binding protein